MARVGDAQSPLAWSPHPLTRSPHLPIARSPGHRPLAPTARRRPASTPHRPVAPSLALAPPPRRPLAPSPHPPVPSSLVAPLHRLPVSPSPGRPVPWSTPSGSDHSSSSSLDPSSPCHPIARSHPPFAILWPRPLVPCCPVASSHRRPVAWSPRRRPLATARRPASIPHRPIAPSRAGARSHPPRRPVSPSPETGPCLVP
ncbi:hypothetical protein BC826DRAFT_1049361 [Russula brevipes]|nr:hypothetical protein BC826DRAFT_1050416 [Russula brevipes]KAI0286287.1 hypothetical protein BC826DRAFT_1049361 [Russula brevipes]